MCNEHGKGQMRCIPPTSIEWSSSAAASAACRPCAACAARRSRSRSSTGRTSRSSSRSSTRSRPARCRPAEIATPLRRILRRQRERTRAAGGGRPASTSAPREVLLDRLPNGDRGATLRLRHADRRGRLAVLLLRPRRVAAHAPELKSLAGALDIRSRVLGAFEAAEVEPDPDRRRSWLTFVVVGAGPTGVEMAGQIAELAHDALRRDFRCGRHAHRARAARRGRRPRAGGLPRVALAEGDRARSRSSASTPLARPHGGRRRPQTRSRSRAATATSNGSAPVRRSGPPASRLRGSAAKLADEAGLDVDRAGRVAVEPDLTLPGPPRGARARRHGAGAGGGRRPPLPGLAPVAMQQGRYAAGSSRAACAAATDAPFRYRDKGNLATIGRSKAVADVKGVHLSGFPAWATWLRPHRLPDRLPEPGARPPAVDGQLRHQGTGRAPDRLTSPRQARCPRRSISRRISASVIGRRA